jgi:hypothetical protein
MSFIIEYNDVGAIAQKKRDEGILLAADSLVKKYEYEKSKEDIK